MKSNVYVVSWAPNDSARRQTAWSSLCCAGVRSLQLGERLQGVACKPLSNPLLSSKSFLGCCEGAKYIHSGIWETKIESITTVAGILLMGWIPRIGAGLAAAKSVHMAQITLTNRVSLLFVFTCYPRCGVVGQTFLWLSCLLFLLSLFGQGGVVVSRTT